MEHRLAPGIDDTLVLDLMDRVRFVRIFQGGAIGRAAESPWLAKGQGNALLHKRWCRAKVDGLGPVHERVVGLLRALVGCRVDNLKVPEIVSFPRHVSLINGFRALLSRSGFAVL